MNQWNVNRPTGGLFGKTPTRKLHGAESSWQDDPRRRRLFLTRWALGIGIAVNAVFAPLDSFMTAHVDQGVAEAICAVAFSIMAVYLRRSGRVEEMLLGAVAMAGAEMLYMLWSGWPDDEVVLWLPVFPAIAFPFLGQRKGVVAGGLFYAGAIGLMLWKPIHMTGEATSNLAGACATAALLIYSSEKTRAHIDQQLQKYADTDYLTGLHNRRSFEQQFGREVARALRHVEPLSLLLLDIDHFKVINDTHGPRPVTRQSAISPIPCG